MTEPTPPNTPPPPYDPSWRPDFFAPGNNSRGESVELNILHPDDLGDGQEVYDSITAETDGTSCILTKPSRVGDIYVPKQGCVNASKYLDEVLSFFLHKKKH